MIASTRSAFSIHVDMDNLWIYESEYGVSANPEAAREVIYTQALPEFRRLLDSRGFKATFFVVGRDLSIPECRQFLREAVADGHEVANHSLSHPIEFHRMTYGQKEREIRGCGEAIEDALGVSAIGFRSPGYYIDRDIIRILIDNGYLYDSSVLPGFAKRLMSLYMNWHGDAGRNKKFGCDWYLYSAREPRALVLSRTGDESLVEYPIAVMPILRMPIHPSFAYKFGENYSRLGMSLSALSGAPIVLLFHAVDFLEMGFAGGLADVVTAFRWPKAKRLALFADMLDALAGRRCELSGQAVASVALDKIPRAVVPA